MLRFFEQLVSGTWPRQLTIDDASGAGSGSGAGAGAGTGSGAGGGTGDGSTSSASGGTSSAPPAAPSAGSGAPAAATRGDGGAPIATQEPSYSLADDAGKPVREMGESSDAFLARFREYRTAHPTEDQVEATADESKVLADQKAVTDKAEADRVAAEAAKQKTPEQVAAEQKAETDRKAEEERARAAGENIFDDDAAPVTTEQLAEAIKKAPAEAEAFFKAAGIDKDSLFADARLAAKSTHYMKLFPTVESAQHAHARAAAFHQLDDAFTEIKPRDFETTSKFVNDALIPMTYLRGADGKVMVDKESGMPLTDGTAFTFLDNVVEMRAKYLSDQCEKMGGDKGIQYALSNKSIVDVLEAAAKQADKMGGDRGERLRMAVDVIKEWGKGGSSSATDDANLPEEVKQELAQSRAERQQTQQREAELNQKQVADFKKAALTESSTRVDTIINGLLDATTLKDDKFLRGTVFSKIRDAVFDALSEDAMYRSQRDGILQINGLTDKGKGEWVALNVRETLARLRNIAQPILDQAGARRISRNAERQATATSQERASRMETKGGTSTALPRPVVTDKHELVAQAKENLRKRGEEVTTDALMKEYRLLTTSAHVPA